MLGITTLQQQPTLMCNTNLTIFTTVSMATRAALCFLLGRMGRDYIFFIREHKSKLLCNFERNAVKLYGYRSTTQLLSLYCYLYFECRSMSHRLRVMLVNACCRVRLGRWHWLLLSRLYHKSFRVITHLKDGGDNKSIAFRLEYHVFLQTMCIQVRGCWFY